LPLWFEEIYQEYMSKPAFKELDKFPVEETTMAIFLKTAKGN
jgi:type III restriction enzyme